MCLYSAASIFFLSLSAAFQSCFSMGSSLVLLSFFFAIYISNSGFSSPAPGMDAGCSWGHGNFIILISDVKSLLYAPLHRRGFSDNVRANLTFAYGRSRPDEQQIKLHNFCELWPLSEDHMQMWPNNHEITIEVKLSSP